MGQIVIDFPTFGGKTVKRYIVKDEIEAVKIFRDIENLIEVEDFSHTPAIEPPRTSRKEGLDAAFGIWADREETGEEIAMRIRKANRRQT